MRSNPHYVRGCLNCMAESVNIHLAAKQDPNSYLAERSCSFGCASWIKVERENSERPLPTPITHHGQKHTHAAARCFFLLVCASVRPPVRPPARSHRSKKMTKRCTLAASPRRSGTMPSELGNPPPRSPTEPHHPLRFCWKKLLGWRHEGAN